MPLRTASRQGYMQVWSAVDNQARKQHTSIIHGKYSHEETIATASFATTYLIVRDLAETQYVVDYILNGGDRDEFLAKFSKAISEVRTYNHTVLSYTQPCRIQPTACNSRPASRYILLPSKIQSLSTICRKLVFRLVFSLQGFDPDRDLVRIGLANQTTMLRDETLTIGKMLEKVMMQKYGPADLKDHYMVLDTICDATQAIVIPAHPRTCLHVWFHQEYTGPRFLSCCCTGCFHEPLWSRSPMDGMSRSDLPPLVQRIYVF